ncbi:MAG: ATP-binding protein [Acidimicrobiales bacterium]
MDPAPDVPASSRPSWSTRVRMALGSGIRPRVVAAYVALLVAALAVSTVAVHQVLHGQLDRRIEADLDQEATELDRFARIGIDPATGEPLAGDAERLLLLFLERNLPGTSEAFYTIVDGRPFLTSFDPPTQLLADADALARWGSTEVPVRESIDTEVGRAEVLVTPLVGESGVSGVFIGAIFPTDEHAEIDQAVLVVAAVSGALAVLASILAWGLVGRILRPVGRLTAAARRITDSDASARIPVEGDDELAELTRTFNQMLDRIEEGSALRRAFLNDVAHELRTPITIVRGHLELLGDDPDERSDTIALVTDELDRMTREVDDLLVLAKSEQPDFVRLEPVDAGDLAEDLTRRVVTLGDRHWQTDQRPSPGHHVVVVDPERVVQAVTNLATNAVQHTAPANTITVRTAIAGRSLLLEVEDDGPGVDPEVVPHLFDRATRGSGSRRSRREGTGLGLAIVAAIAAAHGGTVDVSSTPGHGARFTIEIPDCLAGDPHPTPEHP